MVKKTEAETKEVETLKLSEEELQPVPTSYVPEGFETVEDYLADLRETHELDLSADDDNRQAALEDKKFVAGEQWDPQVLQQRAGLPNLVINTMPQFIAQLVGDWRENRNGIKVLPSENGDKNVADIRADLIRAIETKSRATRAYDSAFESMCQCGDGAFRVDVQYASEDVFDQDIQINPIDDALSVVWDRLSIDPTGRDANHCFVDDILPKKEFIKKFGEGVDPSTLQTDVRRSIYNQGWFDDNSVRVTEHWRMIERKVLLVMFEDGSIHQLSEDTDPQNLDEKFSKHGAVVKTRLAPCRYAQMHLVTGYAILAGPYEWKLNRLPIIRMSGRTVSIGNRRVRYGLVRFMKDAARLRNFWRSVAAEQLGYAPKAQWIATESAVEGKEAAIRKAHLSRDPLLIVNDEAVIGQNIQRLEPPTVQMALLQEAQVNTQDMKDVTGIHDASLGIKSNETSGRAIMARQREGDVASLTFYDNGNAAILEAGDVTNQLISQIFDGTRIIRIIGEDESTKLVTINDPMDPKSPNLALGNYDVSMTTGASYTTRRVEAAQAMMEAIQVAPEIMQVAGDLVVKAQDWPGAEELSERMRKAIPPQLLSDKEKAEMGDQGPNVQQLMQQQALIQEQAQKMGEQLQKLEMENAALKAKHDIETRRLTIEEYKAETDRLLAYGQFAAKDKEFELREMEREADLAMHEDNLEQSQQEIDNAKEAQKAQTAQKASTQTDSTPSSE